MNMKDQLERWLKIPVETEHLEFKEAKQQFDTTKLLRYCVALANEGGGHLILGVNNEPPRQVVGTNAFPSEQAKNKIKARIVEKLHIRVDICEVDTSVSFSTSSIINFSRRSETI